MSPSMYLSEKTWEHVEINATISNMITVILSIRKPSSMEKDPMSSQVNPASCLKFGS